MHFTHEDIDGDQICVVGPTPDKTGTISVNGQLAYLPDDPDDLRGLLCAIAGRDIAEIIYTDELPDVQRDPAYDDDGAAYQWHDGHGPQWKWSGMEGDEAPRLRRGYLASLAVRTAERSHGAAQAAGGVNAAVDWTQSERERSGQYVPTCRGQFGGFCCTRPQGHAGPHAAGTGREVLAVWSQ